MDGVRVGPGHRRRCCDEKDPVTSSRCPPTSSIPWLLLAERLDDYV